MLRPTPEKLEVLRERYPKGCRVKLLRLNDPYRPDLKEGAMGTVNGVNFCTVMYSEGSGQDD